MNVLEEQPNVYVRSKRVSAAIGDRIDTPLFLLHRYPLVNAQCKGTLTP